MTDPEDAALALLADGLGAAALLPSTIPSAAADAKNEAAVATRFDAAVTEVGLFHVYPEVWGTLIRPNPLQEPGRMRIDRILLPTQQLLDMGWTHGAVGVELKSEFQATRGPALSQALDYKNSVWTLPVNTVSIWLDYVFIYPMRRPFGQLESVLAHQHLGTAYSDHWRTLAMYSGGVNIFTAERDGRVRMMKNRAGRKAGSR